MNYRQRSCILFALTFSVFLSLFIFPAAAVDVNETENNNTMSTADVTIDDYNNYGVLSSTTDKDFWKITFSQTGMVNFWLGQVPASCEYKITLYEAGSSLVATNTTHALSNAGLIRAHVVAGQTLYVCISTVDSVSTNQYLFRAKWYPLNRAGIFEFNADFPSGALNTTVKTTVFQESLWRMGYDCGRYYNNHVPSFYNFLPSSDIVLFNGHGNAGYLTFCGGTYMYANSGSENNYDFADYSSQGLSQVDLLIMASCFSGNGGTLAFGDLIAEAKNAGAMCVIGWNASLNARASDYWPEYFFQSLEYGSTVAASISAAQYRCEQAPSNISIHSNDLRQVETGTSPTSALVPGIIS